MNLKHLSDSDLLQSTRTMVARERELLSEILWHLEEIDRRRLFADLGCSSLYAYAVQVLGYSEDQAYRRISAMRLLRSMPKLEEKIQAGKLNVSHLSLAQTVFRRESQVAPLTLQKKEELLGRLEHKTSREAQVIALDYSSAPISLIQERERPLTQDFTELKLTLPKATLEKLHRLKGLKAHTSQTVVELIDQLCDLGLKHWDPLAKSPRTKPAVRRDALTSRQLGDTVARPENRDTVPTPEVRDTAASRENGKAIASRDEADAAASREQKDAQRPATTKVVREGQEMDSRRYTSAQVERRPAREKLSRPIVRQVWQRDRGECRNCGSRHALQVDHVQPLARGGSNEPANLRLLCRTCNQRQAIRKLGLSRMKPFLE